MSRDFYIIDLRKDIKKKDSDKSIYCIKPHFRTILLNPYYLLNESTLHNF